jgi:23S rRNA (guanine1835-N2)-methyltransferase
MLKKQGLKIKRYPASTNRSLQAWSSADEHILIHLKETDISTSSVITYGDSFGYLTSQINAKNHYVIVNTASQQGAIEKNLSENKTKAEHEFLNPLQKPKLKPKFGLVKIPKSLELFELYLDHFTQHSSVSGQLICGFMTRHFSKQMVELGERYFQDITQSKATKKSRLLILKKPIKQTKKGIINQYSFKKHEISQYFGVFSSKSIDPASQFLIDNLPKVEGENKVLDLGCGNGIIAKVLLEKDKDLNIHLVDDSFLALESAKLNVTGSNVAFHHAHNLDQLNSDFFDLIVSNPPFHVEHEIDISLPLRLFRESHRTLKVGGAFRLVSNQHLNYKTHLVKIFSEVEIISENDKYVIYNCIK